MANEKNIGTPAEEEIEIITLTDENGEDMDFEFLDLVEYEGKRYAVSSPTCRRGRGRWGRKQKMKKC
ncbi:MAG: hypothetical protein ACLRZ5_16635 [Ruminococcus sp.]